MPRFKDQAVCIREIDWSETSQVVALLTESHGVVRGLAKGSKRTSAGAVARFSGGIEVLTLGQIVGSTRPSSDLANLTEWDLQDDFHHLRTDFDAQMLAFYAADITAALVGEGDPHPRVFALLSELLGELAHATTRETALLRFQWRLLTDCGYQPDVRRDVHEGKPLPDRTTYAFDARAGGFTAQRIGNGSSTSAFGPWKVRRETLALLREIDTAEHAQQLKAAPDVVTRANRLLCVYIRAILDRQLPTMRYVLGE